MDNDNSFQKGSINACIGIICNEATKVSELLSFIKPLLLYVFNHYMEEEDYNADKLLINKLIDGYSKVERKVDRLLKNTLPEQVAEEIKIRGKYKAREFVCTILFADFVAFTKIAEAIEAAALLEMLDEIFINFDTIIADHMGTKIKTMGDAYMAIFGAPERVDDHPVMAVRAAASMLEYLNEFNKARSNTPRFQMRVGIHTGKVIAGVVGKDRMQFDVFGDNVNIGSRLQSSGEAGRINISEETYQAIKHLFPCEKRGLIELKNKKPMMAYFVNYGKQ